MNGESSALSFINRVRRSRVYLDKKLENRNFSEILEALLKYNTAQMQKNFKLLSSEKVEKQLSPPRGTVMEDLLSS
jgi:hypothetical protein